MKLFSFPQAILEKAIAQRALALAPADRAWFLVRWGQKPYKKSFLDLKAMPLVTFFAKGKNWTDQEFADRLAEWKVEFHAVEAAVLRPLVDGDGLIQLMQKKMPRERADALIQKLENDTHA
jgi:hypothetical protein